MTRKEENFYTVCNIAFGNLHRDFPMDDYSRDVDEDIAWLFPVKEANPAFQQVSARQKISTSGDLKYYASGTTSRRDTQRMLVLDFQRDNPKIALDLSGLSFSSLTDLKTHEKVPRAGTVSVAREGLGYRFFTIDD